LLSGEPELKSPVTAPAVVTQSLSEQSRLDALEDEVKALKAEIHALREEVAEFKKLVLD
jgi:hypothetical protein